MSDVANIESLHVIIPTFTTHVFVCPACRNETTVLSSQSFICLEQTQCESCGREIVIENDRAHVLQQ
jgi:DNA replicative helicase MCM subunit Mcm2 (Cdc46/Mcm family)